MTAAAAALAACRWTNFYLRLCISFITPRRMKRTPLDLIVFIIVVITLVAYIAHLHISSKNSDLNAGEVVSFNKKHQEYIRRKLRSKRSQSQIDVAKGKTVALLQVHFEGNVGDQMETIPLLRKLKEWGVVVDCYLSVWMPLKKRLDPNVHARVKDLVRNIYPEGVQYDHDLRDRNYDLLIVTPGPTVNEVAHCITATRQLPNLNWATGTDERPKNISMVWFGVTITGWAERTYEKQKYCTKLIAVREEGNSDQYVCFYVSLHK